MAAQVYFCPARFDDPADEWAAKVRAVSNACGLDRIVDKKNLVAIKLHFGERGNTCHIRPQHVRPLVDFVKESEGKPFLAETSTLYVGARSNAVDHISLAHEHGFTLEAAGAPVIIADGLLGNAELDIPVNGTDGKTVSLAADIVRAHACIVATHVTGHCQAGLGGLIKNVAMGTASRKGKLHQHSEAKPKIDPDSCVLCGECVEWCPAGAIEESDDVDAMAINDERCIGCGECLTICRNNAVKFDWRLSSAEMQRRMAEQMAGLHHQKDGKIAYVSFLVNISKDCDCIGKASEVILEDIGIVAGFAPLAVERATMDLIRERSGKTICEHYWPQIDPTVVLTHGQALGLGETSYEVIEVKP